MNSNPPATQNPKAATQSLSVEEAKHILRTHLHAAPLRERLSLRAALGRVLALDIISPIDVPAHPNSAMDGFAFHSREFSLQLSRELSPPGANTRLQLQIVGEALAGHPYLGECNQGQCIRIMTGAVLPSDCDTVIAQEFCQITANASVSFESSVINAGENCRARGEDLKKDSVALQAGKILQAADLGLLASLGIGEIEVNKKLKVAYFSTGDEIRSIGETLDEGCIYDSNRYTVFGMLSRLGCDIIDMGVIADHASALEEALKQACDQADVIITSGGVSVGAADYTKQVMATLGEVAFWTIAMRPGRPLAFGQIRNKEKSAALFGLPGNPVASMIVFYFLVRDALLQQMGAQIIPPHQFAVASAQFIKKRPGRTEYQRAQILYENGQQSVKITGAQGSGILNSMSTADCMIVLEHERADVQAGELVQVIPFFGLL